MGPRRLTANLPKLQPFKKPGSLGLRPEGVSVSRSTSPVVGLLGQALMRGGRGVSTGETVRELSKSTTTAFDGASDRSTSPWSKV